MYDDDEPLHDFYDTDLGSDYDFEEYGLDSSNSSCLPMTSQCDGIIDCPSCSDEVSCFFIVGVDEQVEV